jgi:hypothetical protein
MLVSLAKETPQSPIKGKSLKKAAAPVDEASDTAIETGITQKSPSIAAKPVVDIVEPGKPGILRSSPQKKFLEDAIKDQILGTKLPKTGTIPMAKPDVPLILSPRPYDLFPTNQGFYLPEKPPEGVSPLVAEIHEHLKKRPPVHEPDEVIAEDLSIKDAKEM